MVGGIVVKIIEGAEKTLVVRGTGDDKNYVLHVRVESGADVEATDSVWWQGDSLMVSRGSQFEKVFQDRPVRKIGFSGGGYHPPPAA